MLHIQESSHFNCFAYLLAQQIQKRKPRFQSHTLNPKFIQQAATMSKFLLSCQSQSQHRSMTIGSRTGACVCSVSSGASPCLELGTLRYTCTRTIRQQCTTSTRNCWTKTNQAVDHFENSTATQRNQVVWMFTCRLENFLTFGGVAVCWPREKNSNHKNGTKFRVLSKCFKVTTGSSRLSNGNSLVAGINWWGGGLLTSGLAKRGGGVADGGGVGWWRGGLTGKFANEEGFADGGGGAYLMKEGIGRRMVFGEGGVDWWRGFVHNEGEWGTKLWTDVRWMSLIFCFT